MNNANTYSEEVLLNLNRKGPRMTTTKNKLVEVINPETNKSCKVTKESATTYLARGWSLASADKPSTPAVDTGSNGAGENENENDNGTITLTAKDINKMNKEELTQLLVDAEKAEFGISEMGVLKARVAVIEVLGLE